jgi:hypothetical protein
MLGTGKESEQSYMNMTKISCLCRCQNGRFSQNHILLRGYYEDGPIPNRMPLRQAKKELISLLMDTPAVMGESVQQANEDIWAAK